MSHTPTITDADILKYRILASRLTHDEFILGEIVSKVSLKIHKLITEDPTKVITNAYIWRALKNTYINYQNVQKNKRSYNESVEDKIDEDSFVEDYEEDMATERVQKLDAIEQAIQTLDEFDQHIYLLKYHFNYSLRKISRESGVGLQVICSRHNHIKDTILKTYEKNTNNK